MALTRVEVTNISSSPQKIVELNLSIAPGQTLDLRASQTLRQIANLFSLQKMLSDGVVTCVMVKEAEHMSFSDSDNFQSVLLESRIEELELEITDLESNVSGAIIGTDIGEPVGFVDASAVSMSIDDSTRTLTLSAVSGSYVFYVGGKKLVGTGSKSVSWPDNHGDYFFVLNENGDLQVQDSFTNSIIIRDTFCSIVYWDQAAQQHIYWANEKHGVNMATQTHLYLHNTRGAQFDRGLGLVGFSVDGDGSQAAHAQFTSVSGVIWDEDIKFSIPAQATFPILYRSGTVWKRKAPDSFPVIYSGTAGYTGTRLPYNRLNGGTWSLTEVDPNKFVLVHIFATNDIETPVFGLQGTAQYNSKSAARAGAATELASLSGLPFAEFAPLGSVIFETSNAYTNAVKARIVSTDLGTNYEDKRASYFRPDTL